MASGVRHRLLEDPEQGDGLLGIHLDAPGLDGQSAVDARALLKLVGQRLDRRGQAELARQQQAQQEALDVANAAAKLAPALQNAEGAPEAA